MAAFSLSGEEKLALHTIEDAIRNGRANQRNFIQIRPTQQCFLKTFSLLESLKQQVKYLKEGGQLSVETKSKIESVQDELCAECARMEGLTAPGRLKKTRKKRVNRRSLAIPSVHVRDVMFDACARTSQWLKDERERVWKEEEDEVKKKAALEKQKLDEKQRDERLKLMPYLTALTKVRDLREKANWKAGVALPGAGQDEFSAGLEGLLWSVVNRTADGPASVEGLAASQGEGLFAVH